MNYRVEFSVRAVKDLKPIPRAIQLRIILKVESLKENPFPKGYLKLKGKKEELYRIRVGDYRILYQVDSEISIVDIRRIGHRKDIY